MIIWMLKGCNIEEQIPHNRKQSKDLQGESQNSNGLCSRNIQTEQSNFYEQIEVNTPRIIVRKTRRYW